MVSLAVSEVHASEVKLNGHKSTEAGSRLERSCRALLLPRDARREMLVKIKSLSYKSRQFRFVRFD